MLRTALRWTIWVSALFILSACSILRDSQSPAALPPAAAQTPTPVTPAQPPALTPALTPHHPIFDGPLTVKILEPADNQVVDHSPVAITGQADADTVITINEAVILVDPSGKFSASIPLNPGDNLIEITASTTQNAQDFAYLNVIYEPKP